MKLTIDMRLRVCSSDAGLQLHILFVNCLKYPFTNYRTDTTQHNTYSPARPAPFLRENKKFPEINTLLVNYPISSRAFSQPNGRNCRNFWKSELRSCSSERVDWFR
eukprot:GILJ01029408.1.p1 GENE.GILJ01029408.1~~GILJ01029408.1.p1  ORF type:complete len:106 (+),score=2.43 GILJ01029408.1:97-414(+)